MRKVERDEEAARNGNEIDLGKYEGGLHVDLGHGTTTNAAIEKEDGDIFRALVANALLLVVGQNDVLAATSD